MITRWYVHNFRCLENFDLSLGGMASSLLIGRNGTGKSSILLALSLLQRIARGTNRVGHLVKPKDFSYGRTESPMRFELEAELQGKTFQYVLALELPARFHEVRVFEERLVFDGQPLFTRELSKVTLGTEKGQARFGLDWHLAALPIVQERDDQDPIAIFKRWLSRMLLLAPEPRRMTGESSSASLEPELAVEQFGSWFTGLVAATPEAYTMVTQYLSEVMPDFRGIQNPMIGSEARSLRIHFKKDTSQLTVSFSELSDGEKGYFVCALALAANASYGPLFCFWDEPDAHLSTDEVRHFVTALRRGYAAGGQLLVSSHNKEAIHAFSEENTFVLSRRSHLEPTQVRLLEDITPKPLDIEDALLVGASGPAS